MGGDLAIRGDKVKMGAAVPAQRPISAREENKVLVNNHVRDQKSVDIGLKRP